MTFEGLQRLRKLKTIPAPMTEVEQELQSVRLSENASINPSNAPVRQTLKGVAFPVDQEALERLEQFRNGLINYVQLVRFGLIFLRAKKREDFPLAALEGRVGRLLLIADYEPSSTFL